MKSLVNKDKKQKIIKIFQIISKLICNNYNKIMKINHKFDYFL